MASRLGILGRAPNKSKPTTDNDKFMQRVLLTDYVKDNYNIIGKTGKWEEDADRDVVCNEIIDKIKSDLKMDPRAFANTLNNPAHKKLIYRCLARQLKMSEDCGDEDLTTAFAAMKMTEEEIINGLKSTMGASANGGGALYQVGGAFGDDVALALLFRLVNTPYLNATLLNAALKAPAAFTGALNWAASTQISDCLKSFLGIDVGEVVTDGVPRFNDSYYTILTNKIAAAYYRSAEFVDEYKAAFKTWLAANPMDALGFMAVVIRYPDKIINITSATIDALKAITVSTFAATFAIGSTIWPTIFSSDSGVLVCVLLYFYEKYRDQFDDIIRTHLTEVKTKFIEGINALGVFETIITDVIDDTRVNAQLEVLNTRLVGFKDELTTDLVAQMTAENLILIAAVASMTSKLRFEATQAVQDSEKINALTGELNSALNALTDARIIHADALNSKQDAIVSNKQASRVLLQQGQPQVEPPVEPQVEPQVEPAAMSVVVPGPGTSFPGGKSRSRKSHKKV